MRPFLELLRPANITTALADVLAGFAIADLANPAALPWLLVATACLYGGGVVLNDFFDRGIDAVERPERPIPSGRVRPSAAALLGFALVGAGILAASRATPEAFRIAGLIAAAVLLYDAGGKRHLVFGPIIMGLCRGLNLTLGMAAAAPALTTRWELGFLPFLYIWSITVVSRGEVHGGTSRPALLGLVAVSGVVLALAAKGAGLDLPKGLSGPWNVSMARDVSPLGLLLAAALAWRVLGPLWRAYRAPGPGAIRLAVRAGVLSLVLLDAALAAIYAGTLYGLVVLSSALLAAALARLFAVT